MRNNMVNAMSFFWLFELLGLLCLCQGNFYSDLLKTTDVDWDIWKRLFLLISAGWSLIILGFYNLLLYLNL